VLGKARHCLKPLFRSMKPSYVIVRLGGGTGPRGRSSILQGPERQLQECYALRSRPVEEYKSTLQVPSAKLLILESGSGGPAMPELTPRDTEHEFASTKAPTGLSNHNEPRTLSCRKQNSIISTSFGSSVLHRPVNQSNQDIKAASSGLESE
jgi:hypothetical protein